MAGQNSYEYELSYFLVFEDCSVERMDTFSLLDFAKKVRERGKKLVAIVEREADKYEQSYRVLDVLSKEIVTVSKDFESLDEALDIACNVLEYNYLAQYVNQLAEHYNCIQELCCVDCLVDLNEEIESGWFPDVRMICECRKRAKDENEFIKCLCESEPSIISDYEQCCE